MQRKHTLHQVWRAYTLLAVFSLQSCNNFSNKELLPHGRHRDEEEKDHHYFTKCEYYTRYAGTSHFAMDNCEYWGTYFRSTGRGGESGRFTRKDMASKTFKNKNLNIEKGSSYHSRTGTFRNPYEEEEYRKSVEKPEEFKKVALSKQKINLETPLYEELLDYRNQICLQVFNRALELLPNSKESFELIHHNEYPCLIVKVPFIQHFKHTESWNKLFIAYYVAIINKEAEKEGIPIEMVIRSGFGHLLPSIDVTGSSFRINVGVVPASYAELLAKSLAMLQEIIVNKLNNSLESYEFTKGSNDFIDKINKRIRSYNKSSNVLPLWGKQQKCYEILQLTGDPSGKSVICQITRKRMYLDLLADYVASELDNQKPNLTLPIVRMLGHLEFGAAISTNINQSSFKRNARKWSVKENALIQKDDHFWKIITQTVQSIDGSREIYDSRTLYGLYSKLEKANKGFIIRSASTLTAEYGLGSDSEGEVEGLQKQRFYAKKLTVTTGMMAINVAHYLAKYYLKKYLGIEQYRAACKSMYYETEDSLKLSASGQGKLAVLNNRKSNNKTVLFFDLNHCDVSGAQSSRLKHYIDQDLVGKSIPVMVMDYTSSTTSHIKCAINDAIHAGVKLILLVSSGLKNEQLSADNPYGTVRIITLDKAQREELYKEATEILKENGGIPATAHKIRKGYKEAKLIPTNQQILTADTSRKDFNEQAPIIVSHLYKNPYEIDRYKKTLLGQIDHLFKTPIQITPQQRKLIGEARAKELEKETVIGQIENTLRKMIVDELQSFVKEQIQEERDTIKEKVHTAYQQAEMEWQKDQEAYQEAKEDYEEGNGEWDYEGLIEPNPPVYPDMRDIKNEYKKDFKSWQRSLGDLNNLSNLIKVTKIQDDTLSQILYDNFINVDAMDDILEALEYNTLNLNPKLVRRILNNCDVQFYQVNPAKDGFLIKYLKESIEARFQPIAVAYLEGRDEQGRTPLHIAAEQGHYEEVNKLLLNQGTAINAQDKYGYTPLHLASKKGHLEVVKLLVTQGAHLNAKTRFGETPLYEALLDKKLEVFKFLLGLWKSPPTLVLNNLLCTAARQGDVQSASLLIERGANANAQDEQGNTPLHFAALNAHVEVLAFLIEKKVDVNMMNNQGNTPLDEAVGSILCSSNRYPDYEKTCQLLRKGGAFFNAQNNQEVTPMQLVKQKNPALYKLLTQ